MPIRLFLSCTLLAWFAFVASSCSSTPVVSAEEYYSLGVAYFDLGKFAEAERWFLKAKKADKTRVASEYNLGRIAFELGRFEESATIFEELLKRDPDNTMLLKAAAYARLKMGDFERARGYYARVVELKPETTDSNYNYALVLHAMGQDSMVIELLSPIILAHPDDRDSLLLLARSEKSLEMPESIDHYATWLDGGDDPIVRREFAENCTAEELYARAIENYDQILSNGQSESAGVPKGAVRFAKARVLFIAGSVDDGIIELKSAITEGFKDEDAIEALTSDERITVDEKTQQAISEALDQVASNSTTDSASSDEGAPSSKND